MEKYARFKYMPPIPLGKDGKRVTASKEYLAFSREAATECAVLLKNEQNALPLKNEKVALLGMGSYNFLICGRGSGEIYTSYHQNLYDGLKEKECKNKLSLYEPVSDLYNSIYLKAREINPKDPNLQLEEPEVDDALFTSAAAECDTAVITIGRYAGEGYDRKAVKGDYYLSDAEEKLIDKAGEYFKNVVVVLNIGAVMDCEYLADNEKVTAILCVWQPGIEGGAATADLLVGDKNPSGKLADTITKSYDAYPDAKDFAEHDYILNYTDDIYVGYRYFETIPGKKELVRYPFGYGISYTTFDVTEIKASEKDGVITAAATVKNTGDVAGKEVIQVYYSAPQGILGKPARELAAFAKTDLLQPGQSQTLTLEFNLTDMASFDDLGKIQKSAYVLEKGDYEVFVGTSVRETQKAFVYTTEDNVIVQQLTARCVPGALEKRMLSDGTYEALPTGNFPMIYGTNRPIGGTAPQEQVNFDKVGEEISVEDFMTQLTDDELLQMVVGKSGFGLCNTACFAGIDRLDIPRVPTTDGPAGVRLWPQTGCYTTCWPSATALASSWDIALLEKVSTYAAMEAKENNFGVWLTPALNIHKDPLCGRNFEYFSEDPFVSGKMAAAIVRGMQSLKIAPSVKHFACNNKETNRTQSDSRVSERALREIYLKGFEICVKESDPWSIMTSYNKLNGVYTSSNYDLITGILRGEWGYKGMVTSDWDTPSNKILDIKAGNDMTMPTCSHEQLAEAFKNGELTRADLEVCVKRILNTYLKLV